MKSDSNRSGTERPIPLWNSLWAVLALASLSLNGCATAPSAVVSQYFDLGPQTWVEMRMKSEAVRLGYVLPKSRGEGATLGMREVSKGLAAKGGVLVLPMLPLAALAGSMLGVNPEEATRAEFALTNAAAQMDITRDLANEILRLGNQLTPYHWTTNRSSSPGQQASAKPTNTLVLEVSVSIFALAPVSEHSSSDGEDFINARLKLIAEVGCVSYPASSPEKWITHRVHSSSGSHKFTRWAADDARLLREAFAKSPRSLARRILLDMFEAREPGS